MLQTFRRGALTICENNSLVGVTRQVLKYGNQSSRRVRRVAGTTFVQRPAPLDGTAFHPSKIHTEYIGCRRRVSEAPVRKAFMGETNSGNTTLFHLL